MSDNPAADPTMDEILASIRRIISDDTAPQAHAPTAAREPQSEFAVAVMRDAEESDMRAARFHPPVMQDMEDPIDEEPMTGSQPSAGEPLVGEAAASASASAFETLAETAQQAGAARRAIALPPPGRTLEDLTADVIRPILKTWLDENLPEIVRDRVDEEVRRIARGRVR